MWGQRLPPEACLDPREACTFAYTQIGHENSKESRCVDLPSFGRLPVVWAVGARVHGVFTGEGLSCPVLSCIVCIHVPGLLFFPFRSHLFRFFNPLCFLELLILPLPLCHCSI